MHSPVRTQTDLERFWRAAMEPLGFASQSLWVVMLAPDGTPFPHLTQIEECDQPPTPEEAATLAGVLGEVLDEVVPGGRLALLRSRPGGSALTSDDRRWATALAEAFVAVGLPAEPVHVASDADLRPVTADDLAA
ncbi:MAG: hypothetical protein CMH83_16240 [Nocardioides sp.]|nr:hypothetical protein [Nocardioides sp.]